MLAACATTADEGPFLDPSLLTTYYTCGADTHPFPALDSLEVEWYESEWRAAREPSLYQQSLAPDGGSANVYRFTWLRSFHAPMTVRIDEGADGRMHLTAKRLTGAGGYNPGHIAAVIDRPLTSAEADDFRTALAANDLVVLRRPDCTIGVDGAEWIFETRKGSEYHFAQRWSPSDGAMRKIGEQMLRMTRWNLEPIY